MPHPVSLCSVFLLVCAQPMSAQTWSRETCRTEPAQPVRRAAVFAAGELSQEVNLTLIANELREESPTHRPLALAMEREAHRLVEGSRSSNMAAQGPRIKSPSLSCKVEAVVIGAAIGLAIEEVRIAYRNAVRGALGGVPDQSVPLRETLALVGAGGGIGGLIGLGICK